MKLLEIFKDFEITINGKGQHGKYSQTFTVVPKTSRQPITLKDLQNYICNLQAKHPNRHFYLKKQGKYYVLTQKKTITDENTQKEIKWLKQRLKRIEERIRHTLYPSVIDRAEKQAILKQIMELNKKVKTVKDRVPIFFDLKTQRFYVPKSFVEKKYALTCYIIMRTLGALGASQSKYMGSAD